MQVDRLPIRISIGITRGATSISAFYETGEGWMAKTPPADGVEFDEVYRHYQNIALLLRIARNAQVEAAETIAELEEFMEITNAS
jgi:hypothetical protein